MQSGSIDLGGEVLEFSSEVETRVVVEDLVRAQTEVGTSSSLGPTITRKLDPQNVNDNCMVCLAHNEQI